jgi:hypothetical protein
MGPEAMVLLLKDLSPRKPVAELKTYVQNEMTLFKIWGKPLYLYVALRPPKAVERGVRDWGTHNRLFPISMELPSLKDSILAFSLPQNNEVQAISRIEAFGG